MFHINLDSINLWQSTAVVSIPRRNLLPSHSIAAAYVTNHTCMRNRRMAFSMYNLSSKDTLHFEFSANETRIENNQNYDENNFWYFDEWKTNLIFGEMNQRWNIRYQVMSSQTPYHLIVYHTNKFTMCCHHQILSANQFYRSQQSTHFTQCSTIVVLIG